MAKKYLSEQIEKAVTAAIQSNPFKKKIEDALLRAEKRCNKDIENAIKKIIYLYYADYTPTQYKRTHQLKLSIAPYTALIISDDGYTYSLYANLHEDRDVNSKPTGKLLFLKMDHSKPKIEMTYKKKDGTVSHYKYQLNYNGLDAYKYVREEEITTNFLKNIHGTSPVGGVKGKHNLLKIYSGELKNIISKKLPKYIQEEISKIK